ncbi:Protein C07A12.18 a [Aphelenchoides avenae]|nr:Protein C07A12.18 a [Aphelenchus avenae]
MILCYLPTTYSISCYECISGSDRSCGQYVGKSCGYGFFGCVKIGTYSGGVDKLGDFIDDPSTVVSMIRGCNMLPFGGVDACTQNVILGYRIVTPIY